MRHFLFYAFLFLFSPSLAFGYLDPGTGSLLLSSFIALIASGVFFFKSVFYKLIALTNGGGGVTLKKQKAQNHSLVFYSEGKQYHNVFKPILEYLDSINYPYTYLTSSKEDYELFMEYKKGETKISSKNISESAAGFLGDFKGCEARGEGSLLNINDRAECAHSRKSTKETTPKAELPQSHFEYIGSIDTSKAISRLNNLKADIVMMTTPQLEVLQIKRSKGVKHYCHIIHSLPHVDIYEIFALDYFDSVFTNSSIHTDFIRETERVRGIKKKEIVITGCTYLDILQEKLREYQSSNEKIEFFENNSSLMQSQNLTQDARIAETSLCHSKTDFELSGDISATPQYDKVSESSTLTNATTADSREIHCETHLRKTILLAPSWGREALLSKYGMELIKPFIDSDYNLIIRPHPQSLKAETSLIDSLKEQTKHCKNIAWDTNRDNIYALAAADLMIGDFSGVIFDFVCLFEKPVITPEFHFNIIGYDLEDIYDTPWVKGALQQIGRSIPTSEFNNLPRIIDSILKDTSGYEAVRANITKMKEELWRFQGEGGSESAKAILAIQKGILESSLKDLEPTHRKIIELDLVLKGHSSAVEAA